MGENIIAVFQGESDWLHQAATGCRSVAGIHIDVSAPEALWTVIGVAVSLDGNTTVHAGEIFNVALEFFVQVRYSKV